MICFWVLDDRCVFVYCTGTGLKMTDGSGSRNQGASVGNGSSSSSSSEQAPVADDNDYSGPTTRRRAAATRS